jgi:predicted HD phosphohydrolase
MTDAEAEAFERDPLFKEKIQLRKFDEAAKRVGFEVPGLEAYQESYRTYLLG